MDRYNGGAYAQTDGNAKTATESRRSTEGRAPQTPRLQKKKSNAGVKSASQPVRNTIAYSGQNNTREIDEGQQGLKAARKGSLRNVIRRVFGRRSREAEPALHQASPPRHGYHRSEPVGVLPTQPEERERSPLGPRISQRNFSVPLDLPPASMFPRTRSPYAVEFPQSSRLKPLNLGNPFDAPGSQLRRRKTLPSVLVTPEDAAAIKASMDCMVESSVPQASGDAQSSQIGRAISTRGSDKRRSRSETDLRGGSGAPPKVPQRKRSDEIRYWRESYQPNVLRASGFRVSSLPAAAGAAGSEEGEKTPIPKSADPSDGTAAGAESSPQVPGGPNVSAVDDYSFSALGSELSRDLEDRVAKLENGLRNFQASLEKLNADRNRRTLLVTNTPEAGSVPVGGRRRRASSGGRTASILAGDLQGDLAPSSYQYDYADTLRARPSTSPRPPRTPAGVSGNPTLPVPQPRMDDPFVTPSPPPALLPGANENQGQVPQHTFRSLYEMLSDERSARRRLEQTMRNLQEEIASLHYQVLLNSNVQSHRSSFMPSSSRLQALLAGTEESPPGTAESQLQRFSGGTGISIDPRVVSRFSGSDSEGVPTEGLETPHEAYQTPLEEHSPGRFAFGPGNGQQPYGSREEGGMF